MKRLTLLLILLALTASAQAEVLRIAVASNFAHSLRLLGSQFEAQTGHTLRIASGSTGKHYAQILQGAPFDLFLAADALRPQKLAAANIGIPDSRVTYALGQLVLWSPETLDANDFATVLRTHSGKLAIANPKLAPYGSAAQQALQQTGLWPSVKTRLIRGENIAQAHAFVRSGNARFGLIAASQRHQLPTSGSYWSVPEALHAPIEQQMLLLNTRPAARALYDFLRSDEVRKQLPALGYGVPHE